MNAVFTRQPFTGAILQGQLYINGELQQTRVSSRRCPDQPRSLMGPCSAALFINIANYARSAGATIL